VSFTPVANLPPVSLIPVANWPPVSLTLVVRLDLRKSLFANFRKIRNSPGAGGKMIHEKTRSKNSRNSDPLSLILRGRIKVLLERNIVFIGFEEKLFILERNIVIAEEILFKRKEEISLMRKKYCSCLQKYYLSVNA
jgi:hypothetical protein